MCSSNEQAGSNKVVTEHNENFFKRIKQIDYNRQIFTLVHFFGNLSCSHCRTALMNKIPWTSSHSGLSFVAYNETDLSKFNSRTKKTRQVSYKNYLSSKLKKNCLLSSELIEKRVYSLITLSKKACFPARSQTNAVKKC